ncbi:MAG: class I adenylate-forming enzyme family protein [Ignavibacteria bacterium]
MNQELLEKIKAAHTINDISHNRINIGFPNIRELLEFQTERTPQCNFLTFYEKGEEVIRFTYEEFWKAVKKYAGYIQSLGIGKEDRVVSFSRNHYSVVLLYFAAWTIGATVVPINVEEDPARIAYIIENSNARALFTLANYLDKIYSLKGKINIRTILFSENLFSEMSENILHNNVISQDTEAMIVYTSGTTGNPKGVVLTQGNLLVDSKAIAEWHRISQSETMMCVLPLHHVNGTVVTLLTPLYANGRVVLNDGFHLHSFFPTIEKESVKVVSVVPTLLQYLIHSDINIDEYNLRKFSHFICGAGPLTCELASNFEKKFGLRIIHGYGLSETTCYSCFIPIDLDEKEHRKWQNEFGFPSIGIPLGCNEMDIHSANGESVREEERGEIVIRGYNVMKYYFNNDIANENAFTYGWFRSGDEGFYKKDDKGNKYFFITGRIKELIIRGGVNISPLEIDEVLMSLEEVKSGIAVGFENDWYGEEVGAAVILRDGLNYENPEEIKQKIIKKCRQKLPFYKCPKVVFIVDRLPVTSTGKFQRTKLSHLFVDYKNKQFTK